MYVACYIRLDSNRRAPAISNIGTRVDVFRRLSSVAALRSVLESSHRWREVQLARSFGLGDNEGPPVEDSVPSSTERKAVARVRRVNKSTAKGRPVRRWRGGSATWSSYGPSGPTQPDVPGRLWAVRGRRWVTNDDNYRQRRACSGRVASPPPQLANDLHLFLRNKRADPAPGDALIRPHDALCG